MEHAGHPEEGLETASPWYRWGPYLSERAWGSVREDYSADGDAWASFPHDHARSRAYRWNEDGMAGISDLFGRLNLALALWNGRDPILKERMFGLTNSEGNHGEDVKEYWWYLDAVPSSSWLRWRYHYPQAAFPYEDLIEENARRSRLEPEYELLDTGIFDDDRYWIVEVHYAKADPTDILARITVRNVGPEAATLARAADALVPQRLVVGPGGPRPTPRGRTGRVADPRLAPASSATTSSTSAPARTARSRSCCSARTRPTRRGSTARTPTTPYPKDGINDHVVGGAATVNPAADRHQGRGLVPADRRRRARPRRSASGCARGRPGSRPPRPRTRPTSWARLRRHDGRAAWRRPTSSTPTCDGPDATDDEARDHAPGVRRDALEQAVLRATTSARWLDGDPGGAAAAAASG